MNAVLMDVRHARDFCERGRIGGCARQAGHRPVCRGAKRPRAAVAGAVFSAGLLNATAGTVAATSSRTAPRAFDMFVGRWMLTFTFSTPRSRSSTSTATTCASPRRTIRPPRVAARVYAFAWRSTIYSYVHAFQLERARLAKFGIGVEPGREPVHARQPAEPRPGDRRSRWPAGGPACGSSSRWSARRCSGVPEPLRPLRLVRVPGHRRCSRATVELDALDEHQRALQPRSSFAPPRRGRRRTGRWTRCPMRHAAGRLPDDDADRDGPAAVQAGDDAWRSTSGTIATRRRPSASLRAAA